MKIENVITLTFQNEANGKNVTHSQKEYIKILEKKIDQLEEQIQK